MGKFKDLTGQKFGKLTVLEYAGKTDSGKSIFLCRCDCAGENSLVIVQSANLKSGNSLSCGCLKREKTERIIGVKFGKLTPIKRVEDNNSGGSRFLCKCDCGNEKVIDGGSLRANRIKSCGCLFKDNSKWNPETVRKYVSSIEPNYAVEFLGRDDDGRVLVELHCGNKNHDRYISELFRFQKGSRCRQCYLESNSMSDWNEENVRQYVLRCEPNYTILEINKKKDSWYRLRLKCNNINHGEYSVMFSDFKRGSRCRKCIQEGFRLTYSYVKNEIEKTNEFKLISNKYENNYEKLELFHKKCGRNFLISYGNFKQGKRCPYCKQSKGERKILNFLEENKIPFEKQKIFPDCKTDLGYLKFDFYISSYNLILEYQGEQHTKEIEFFGGKDGLEDNKKRDEVKRKYCRNKNISLLEIDYRDFKNIEKILIEYLQLETSQQ